MNRAEKRRQRKLAEKAGRKGKLVQSANFSSGQHTLSLQQTLDMALQNHAAGRLSEAEALYKQVLQADPDQPDALHLLGVIAQQAGQSDIAVDLITKALSVKPDFPEALSNIGATHRSLGNLDEAITSYKSAVVLKPDYLEAHYNLANALKEQGKIDEAITSYQNVVVLKPDYVETHYNLANALKEQGRLDEAVASYNKALAKNPKHADAHNNMGIAFNDMGKMDEAINSYNIALTIKPDYAIAHKNLGNTLENMGQLEKAVAHHRRAVAIKPDFAEAHSFMANIIKHTEYDQDIRAMEKAYAMTEISDDQRSLLAFGLGKAFENLQQYKKAFDFFTIANKIKRASHDFSLINQTNFFKTIKTVFNSSLFAKNNGTGCDDETPIFILGMPRSGTTLVEQILASHSQVHGAGELAILNQIVSSFCDDRDGINFPESIRRFDRADFKRMGVNYLQSIRKNSLKHRLITDKMPQNFLFIGLIKLILPNAKVIHCRRDPMDTCLSIFKTNLVTGHLYSNDLSELGSYYTLYRDLMEHWHRVLPGCVYDVEYEKLVMDQAGQTRTLLEYCNLKWDDACLEFYNTSRPVYTASSSQIRKPIYKNSVGSWKQYELQLAPLIKTL